MSDRRPSARAWWTSLLLCGSILTTAAASAADGAAANGAIGTDVAWIEAENPTVKPDIPEFELRPHGEGSFLSGGKVAIMSIDERHTHKALGDAGKIAAWDFTTKTAGKHEIWARIGFEWVRSDFDWRIDDGAWQTAKSTDATTDLQQLAFWCEIAWLKMGEQDLPAGKHSLQLRFMPTHEDKGKQVPARMLWMADAFCIADHFSPNHRFRPDEP
jgi:beta-galactosidase